MMADGNEQQDIELLVEDASTPPKKEDYVFVRDLRLVRPYHFDFKCSVKLRNEGKTIVQLFAEVRVQVGHGADGHTKRLRRSKTFT